MILTIPGIIKSYKLTYEPATIQHAVFDRSRTTNQWAIEARFLKEITAHFSPSAEQLDIYSDGDKAVFTSFTTKVTDGKGWAIDKLL
jgi:cell cycle checkpoint control protein RAD9A